MKRLLTSFLTLSSIILFMLSSCTKNDVKVKNVGSTSSTLTTTATTLILDKTRLTDTSAAIRFTFTAPTYTYKAVVNNSLQIDAAGDNWKSPASAALSTKAGSQGYNTADFNALLLKLNLPAGKASQVNVRVANALSSDVASYSNVITLTVTPFNLVSFIYVAGAFEGWTVPGAGVDSLISPTSNGIYTGIINFTKGNTAFKLLPNSQNYTGNIGSDGTTSGLTAASSQSNIVSTDTGKTLVTVNLNSNTIAFEAVNYYSAIGSSTPPLGNGFTVDNDLKFVNGNQDWELTIGMVAAGGFKIRQNHDWGWSWGVLPTPDGVTLTDNNGGNIPIATVGNYKITFTIPIAPYNVSATPPVTALYTVTAK
jgi:hypothetical protein